VQHETKLTFYTVSQKTFHFVIVHILAK